MSEQTLPQSKADTTPPETVAILTPAHSSLHSRVGRAISRMSAMQMLLVVMLVIFFGSGWTLTFKLVVRSKSWHVA